ncbi:MAG: hypothetical protein ISR65_09225 [Bacteriovoracaceae bacterium]|nr:hypothetical protein [Bacteriovoracaceae bacterium]
MNKNDTDVPLHESDTFDQVVKNIKSKISYNQKIRGFCYKTVTSPAISDRLQFEEVEDLFFEELMQTAELNCDAIGEKEFQKLLNYGLRALDDSSMMENESTKKTKKTTKSKKPKVEEEEYIEVEGEEVTEEEEETEEEGGETAYDSFFELITEVITEVQANPTCEEDYIYQRIKNGMVTRGLEVNFNY